MKKQILQAREEFAILESESLRRITEVEIDKAFSEAKRLAVEKLKEGKIKDYGVLSMIKAHYEGGVEAVEKVLKESPNLVMAIDPQLHHHQAIHHIKDHLLKILGANPSQMDRVTVAMLLSKEFKDIVAKDIYEDFNKVFIEMLNKTRLGIPYVPLRPVSGGDFRGEGQGGMARSNQDNQETLRSEPPKEITDQSIPEYHEDDEEQAEEGTIIKEDQAKED